MSPSRAEKARSTARPVAEDKLVVRLASRLELNFKRLYELVQSSEQYPREIVEMLVLKTLELSPARYKGYNLEELKRITKSVIALVESKAEKKLEVVRSDPSKHVRTPRSTSKPARGQATHRSNGPANAPRPLSQRQQQQADETPSPPPVADIAATYTTSPKGAPKKVSRDTPDYLTVVIDALNELFQRTSELKDACEAGTVDHEDERVRSVIDGLVSNGKVSAKSAGRLLKVALKMLREQYRAETVQERATQSTASTRRQPRPTPVAKPAVTQPSTPGKTPLSPKIKDLFDRLPPHEASSDDAHLSEAGKEKNDRALERLRSMPVTKTG